MSVEKREKKEEGKSNQKTARQVDCRYRQRARVGSVAGSACWVRNHDQRSDVTCLRLEVLRLEVLRLEVLKLEVLRLEVLTLEVLRLEVLRLEVLRLEVLRLEVLQSSLSSPPLLRG